MKPKIFEIARFRDREYVFNDRSEAGETLGLMLESEYPGDREGIILAIPSGGVPVGTEVRDKLRLPFDLMIVRKLQIPENTEAGFGAMTLDGTVFFNKDLLAGLRITQTQIETEKNRVRVELEKRNTLFRGGRAFPDLTGKRVILVDDGLASGFTMLASVHMARKAKAREIVVAVPTAPQRSVDRILPEVDEIYCANVRTGPFFAVASAYRNWYDLSEQEVLDILNSESS
jgi:predicted phosphoribosyltransferase